MAYCRFNAELTEVYETRWIPIIGIHRNPVGIKSEPIEIDQTSMGIMGTIQVSIGPMHKNHAKGDL